MIVVNFLLAYFANNNFNTNDHQNRSLPNTSKVKRPWGKTKVNYKLNLCT